MTLSLTHSSAASEKGRKGRFAKITLGIVALVQERKREKKKGKKKKSWRGPSLVFRPMSAERKEKRLDARLRQDVRVEIRERKEKEGGKEREENASSS